MSTNSFLELDELYDQLTALMKWKWRLTTLLWIFAYLSIIVPVLSYYTGQIYFGRGWKTAFILTILLAVARSAVKETQHLTRMKIDALKAKLNLPL